MHEEIDYKKKKTANKQRLADRVQKVSIVNEVTIDPKTIFKSMRNLEEVIEFGALQLPITDINVLINILMIYHNTLLKIKQ